MATLQKRTVKGTDYWSLVESRRINGKPRPVIIEYFGNTKKFAEKLMSERLENQVLKSYTHGDTFALIRVADKLGIENILDDIFKSKARDGIKRSKSLLLIAIQRVCSPGSKNEFKDWFKTTSLPYDMGIAPQILTSQHFWEQMDGITEDELIKAEDAVTKKILEMYDFELEKIALDYTNYFSYISSTNEKCTIAKRGKNKQKRNDLKQYSLALITTKEMGLPLCSHIYEGNTNDQTEFQKYMPMLKSRIPNYNPDLITLVFDGGSNNKRNFEDMETHYICSFSLSSCKDLYEIDTHDYCCVKVNGKTVKAYRCIQEIWGEKRVCVLTFSKDLYAGQMKGLQDDISKTKNEIDELNAKLSNPKSRMSKKYEDVQAIVKQALRRKHMSEIAEISLNATEGTVQGIGYSVCKDKLSEISHKFFGKKLIITDRDDWSTEEIITTYREQDCIEKIFRATKDCDHFSIRPQYHWTDQKIRVHIFCCLLGLILATILQKMVLGSGVNVSKSQLIDDLSSIRRCWIKNKGNNKVSNVLEEMDGSQAKLWNIVLSI
jgi:transposase